MLNHRTASKPISVYDLVVGVIFAFVLLVILYPLYWIVIASFSNPAQINLGNVWLLPKGFTIAGYREIFTFSNLWMGYKNSVIYTILGTSINIACTVTAGYVLSRKDLIGRTIITIFCLVPLYFSGGMIPTYLQVNRLGINNTMWAVLLPNAMSIFNMIITKTFFQTTIPTELLESARLDGCGNWRFFFSIVLPLSTAIVGVLAVYYAAGHWNNYMNALIYLRDQSLAPLQVILREILIQNSVDNSTFAMNYLLNPEGMEKEKLAQLIKYGTIIVSSVPLLIFYPFMQKYFVKGVMIGSLKG